MDCVQNATVTSRLKQINLVKVSNPFQLDVQRNSISIYYYVFN